MLTRSQAASNCFPELPATVWDRLEQVLERFEDAWGAGSRPTLEDYLDGTGTERQALLVELVHADLEYRIRAGEAVRLESYFERYPELRQDPRVEAELIQAASALREKREQNAATPQGPEPPTKRMEAETPADDDDPYSTRPSADPPRAVPTLPALANYQVLEELGRGGMGVVYKAVQRTLKRTVAVKMILAAGHVPATELARFRTEAEAIARLRHPNIVQVYEVGEERGCPFFSLEFADGGNLARKVNGTPQRPPLAAGVVAVLARAMHYAHQAGVVHRDLKPANVLLTRKPDAAPATDGQAEPPLEAFELKVTDFGLAKCLDSQNGHTHSGAVMGTPSYMAPEQAAGDVRAIGPATDVYALGAILYELLVGRPPFVGASAWDTLDQVRHQEPLTPRWLQPTVPTDLETICLKCLEKDARRRYASAEALAEDLRRFLAGEPILARRTGWWERGLKWAKRRPLAAGLVAVSTLAVLLVVGTALAYQRMEVIKAQAETNEVNRLADLRGKARDEIAAGQADFAHHAWTSASVHYSSAMNLTVGEPSLGDLRTEATELLKESERQLKAQADLAEFRKFADRARYHEMLYVGLRLEPDVAETVRAAERALAIFGVTANSAGPPEVPDCLSQSERAEITAGCFDLLLTLAEAVASPLHPGDDQQRAGQAIRLLKRAADLGVPRSHAYHARLARYLARQGDTVAAQKEAERATALPLTSATDYFLAGQDALMAGDTDRATTRFEKAAELQSESFWAPYFVAICCLRSHKPESARAYLNTCLSRRPGFVWVHVLRGFTAGELADRYHAGGHAADAQAAFAAAEKDFDDAMKANPDKLAAYSIAVNRGVLRTRQGRLDEARRELEGAIRMEPDHYQAYVNLAEVCEQQHRAAVAAAAATVALPVSPRGVASLPHGVPKGANRLDEAAALLGKAIELEKGQASLFRARARLHLERHDDGAALRDLDQIVRLEPHKSGSAVLANDHCERGRILFRAKKYGAALEASDDARRVRDDYPPAHLLRAEVLLRRGEYAEAVKSLDVYLKQVRRRADVYETRGWARGKLGDYRGLIDDYGKALELRFDVALLVKRGWAYVKIDAPALALRDFDEAIKHDPRNGEAYVGRGHAHARLGHHEAAVADAEQALRRRPAGGATWPSSSTRRPASSPRRPPPSRPRPTGATRNGCGRAPTTRGAPSACSARRWSWCRTRSARTSGAPSSRRTRP